jgi:hypothetical protein
MVRLIESFQLSTGGIMVDFTKLTKKSMKRDYKDLLSLFDVLDRQTSHTDPRPAQKEALTLLSKHRHNKDQI